MSFLTRAAKAKKLGARDGFRWRGEEITRIEGLSDAVFAFAVTLLIVSLEVPKNFDELVLRLQGFVAFAACFAQLMIVWYNQYVYFRRYNMQDTLSIVYTMALLFTVLFFTYPLKFVFNAWLGPDNGTQFSEQSQVSELFTIYALGFIAVFTIFFFMYYHAFRHREELALTKLELFDTLHSMREMAIYIMIGLLSLTVANVLDGEYVGWAGGCYALLGLFISPHEAWAGKRRRKLEAEHLLSIETA